MYDIFSLPEVKFPAGFLWGSATAAHQIEGDNIYSNWWAMEQIERPVKSGKACNHYAMYREDVELLAELGHQAYRFTIEWSRIEPAEGEWNQEAVDHYLDLLRRLKARGIKAFVTLFHLTVPQWFDKIGAFTKYENTGYFVRYVEKLVPQIAEYVDGWNVQNESIRCEKDLERTNFNILKTHARCYHLIKSFSKAPVSSAHAFIQQFPNRFYDELDNIMARLTYFRSTGFLLHAIRTGELIAPYIDAEDCPEVKNAMDFWSVNIYTRDVIDSRRAQLIGERFPHKKLRMIDMDFYLEEMFPEGTTAMLELLKDRPVYITENGCSCNDDRFRIVYLSLYLSALKDALDRGVDVRSYFYWSLMDNYEWGSFLPRFGLVEVDFKTFKRTPRPSAKFYREVISNNGVSQDIIRRYLHEMPSLAAPPHGSP
jgi:beta-glucosidase